MKHVETCHQETCQQPIPADPAGFRSFSGRALDRLARLVATIRHSAVGVQAPRGRALGWVGRGGKRALTDYPERAMIKLASWWGGQLNNWIAEGKRRANAF